MLLNPIKKILFVERRYDLRYDLRKIKEKRKNCHPSTTFIQTLTTVLINSNGIKKCPSINEREG